MSNIFELFEKTEVVVTDLIDIADARFCEHLLKEYEELNLQLKAYERGLEILDREIPQMNPAEVDFTGRSFYVMHNYTKATKWTERIAYTSAYSRKYIREALVTAVEEFKRLLIRYFNEKYNLKISLNDDEFDDIMGSFDPANWKVLVGRIIALSGGSLSNAGVNKLKEDFRNLFVRNEQNRPEIKGHTITIPNSYLAKYGERYLSISDTRPGLLLRALGYFETGEIEIPEAIKMSFPLTDADRLTFTTFRKADDRCAKFTGFRIFKNGRLDIQFVSSTAAMEFFATFIEG